MHELQSRSKNGTPALPYAGWPPGNYALAYHEIELALAGLPTQADLKSNTTSLNRFEVARSRFLLRKMEQQEEKRAVCRADPTWRHAEINRMTTVKHKENVR